MPHRLLHPSQWPIHNLSSKFLLLTVPALLLSASLFVAAAYVQRAGELRRVSTILAIQQAERDAGLMVYPLWNLDEALTRGILDRIVDGERVCRVLISAKYMQAQDRRAACADDAGLYHTVTPLNLPQQPGQSRDTDVNQVEHWFRVKPAPAAVFRDLQTLLLLLAIMIAVLVLCSVLALRFTVREPLRRVRDSLRIFRDHGERTPVLWRSNDELGAFIGAYNESLQHQELTEQALSSAKAHAEVALVAAEAATRAKSDFLANMSHEIRTPMNAILGFAGLALRADPSPRLRDYLQKIANAGQNLLGVINDVLDFSKIEAGKLDLESLPFSLQHVLDQIADVFAIKAGEKGLELVVAAEPDVPDNLVGDALRLGQVLLNLVGNAIKFTASGHVRLSIHCLHCDAQQARLEIVVTDTGVGMTDEQQERLFQAFSQADTSISRQYGGTGLGLIISQRLIQQMGGRIVVSSSPGHGSRFSFALNFDRAANSMASTWSAPARLKALNILLVDDTAAAREVLGAQLQSFGFRVTAVDSGMAALAALRDASPSQPFDLVLMDWQMPGMDGIETVRRIQSEATLTAPPEIIMVSAFNREEATRAAGQLAISAFLVKPVNPSTLLDTVLDTVGAERVSPLPPTASDDDYATGGQLRGAQVLLVEDNVINQQVARELLEAAGLRVAIANNGREAVQMVDQTHFDAVLMDVQMPEMDGYQATGRIRLSPLHGNLPIIAMTAHAMAGYREECLSAGMNDYVTKPIDPKTLFAALQRWITPVPTLEPARARPKAATAAEPAPAALAPAAAAAELPGIDRIEAMERLSGNLALLQRLLADFSRDYGDYPARIASAIAATDWTTAIAFCHALKGVSGNLSAITVYSACVALEQALREHDQLNAAGNLAALSLAMREVTGSAGRVEP